MRRFLAALALACLLAPVSAAGGATLPPGFQEDVVFSGLVNPTVVRFSPDGRVFVAEKSGLIKVFDGLADTTPTIYADLRTQVHNYWDRGLLGMALDPQFPADPYVYVLYTRDSSVIGGTAPRWGTAGVTSDPCPNPPGGNVDGCVVSGRLSRLNAEGQETVLIDDWCQQYPSHSQGQIQFGPDGMLYATSGDGAAFSFADWGQDGSPVNPCGDPPGGVGAALTPPTAEGGALRAQDLRTSGDPVTLDGSLIRVNPDNGFAPPTNPLFSSADLNARRIVMHGFRNPFRIAFRPGTSELWIGDVGLGRWEEINRVTELLGTVENGGWPCYEGPAPPPSYQHLGLNICENLYAAGPTAVFAPYFSYSHSARVVSDETCPSGSSSLSGLAFYQGGPYPDAYDGALFFADYSRDCIWAMRAGANGLPNPTDIVTLVAPAAGPVSLEIGPGGDLFYTDFDGGTVRRIRYFPTNQPPVAVAQATPSSGVAPLQVSFDGRGSSDPDGDTLTYAWDLDGDGQYDDSTSPTPSRTYTQDGAVTAGLRVSDPSGASDTDAIVVTVGNTAPVATIGAPSSATTWAVGESVAFAGSATDPQGPLPASAYRWELVLHHCPSTCHEHLVQEFTGETGAFDGPNHDYPAHLELRLTVTDDGGLTDVETVSLQPETVQATFAATTPGLQLTVDDSSAAAPFTRTFITGSTHTVSAPATQTLGGVEFTFVSWSNGTPRVHQLTPTTSATYTAEYSGGEPGSCTYNPATKSVAATVPSAGQATLKVVAGAQILFGAVPMPCAGATSTNTDTVLVTGTNGTPERLTIDESEAPFGPGATAESNTPEIEVVANLGDAADQVAVIGTSGADRLTAGANGLAINADNDVDITFAPSPPPAVELSGGGGVNVLTARGGTGTGAVFGRSVVLRAGSLGDQLTGSNLADLIVGGAGNDDVNGYPGNDTIEGGGGNDKLNGADGNDDVGGGLGADTMNAGAGNDTMRAADGVADAALSGGAGTDTAYYDLLDPVPTSVEIKFLDSEPPPPPPPPPPDTTPPETTITSGPTSPTTQTSATLAFSSNETGSTFECALDLGSFFSCTSPVSYSGLAVGGHEVRVRATDPAGNVDPTPASFTWTIETPPDPPPPPPPPPPESGTCTHSAAQSRATAVIPAGGTGTLAVVGSEIRFAGVACGGATTVNTDTVAVNGSAGSTERLVVDQSQGALAPGATVESVGTVSEIELALALGDAADELVLHGTPGADLLSVGTKGVSFNADTDLDVTFAQMPSSVELVGGAGVDTLTARGGYGTAQVFLGRVTLRGDDGDDALSGSNLDDLIVGGAGVDTVDGNSGNDEIHGNVGNDTIRGQDGNDRLVGGVGADSLTGGNGDDTIDAADGEADTQIHGQIGVDTAYYDSGIDPAPLSVENPIPGPPPAQLTGLAR